MSPRKKIKRRKKSSIKKYHIVLIIALIITGVFLFFQEFGREEFSRRHFNVFSPEEETGYKPVKKQEPALPEIHEKPVMGLPEMPAAPKLPRIAIVVDDLGNN